MAMMLYTLLLENNIVVNYMKKKVERSFNNKYGVIDTNDDYLFDKPCVIGVFPGVMDSQYTFSYSGYFNQLMYLLQIRSTKIDASSYQVKSDYSINDLPFDLLIAVKDEDIGASIINAIKEKEFDDIKHVMRNINFVSFCNGNKTTADFIYKIRNYLIERNFTDEEINEILSEIDVVQIVDNYSEIEKIVVDEKEVQVKRFKPIPYTTTTIVQDIHDNQNLTHIKNFELDKPFVNSKNNNGARYHLTRSFWKNSIYDREGDHFFKDDYIQAPVVNTILSLNIIKAVSSSINKISAKDINISDELNKIIEISNNFLTQIGKDIISLYNSNDSSNNKLTKEEKEELNNYLFGYIRKVFKENIPVKELTEEKINYFSERDKAINYIYSKYLELISEYDRVIEMIDKIKEYYNNYSFNEMFEIKIFNDDYFDTRENLIKILIDFIERFVENFNNIDLNYSDSPSSIIKDELKEYLGLYIISIREKMNDPLMKKIIEEIKLYQNGTNIKSSNTNLL